MIIKEISFDLWETLCQLSWVLPFKSDVSLGWDEGSLTSPMTGSGSVETCVAETIIGLAKLSKNSAHLFLNLFTVTDRTTSCSICGVFCKLGAL